MFIFHNASRHLPVCFRAAGLTLQFPNCHHFSEQRKCFALNGKSRSGTGTHLSEQRRCSSAHGRRAAHASMLASVGTAVKVRHFLRSIGDATKLVDSDRVRFAEPAGVICLICLHTCRGRWKHVTAPAASAGSTNSAFCVSMVMSSSILSTKRTAKRDFFPRGGSNFTIPFKV